MRVITILATFLTVAAIPCLGRTITVDDDSPADFNTIQAAINDANNGDTVLVLPGRYVENIRLLGKNITLTGSDPADPTAVADTIIDGNDVNSVVTFSGTENSTCVLSGFTITDGNAPKGGGIYGNGTTATISHNLITSNKAVGYGMPGSQIGGGGIYGCAGLIRNCTIRDNRAYMGGGLSECHGRIEASAILENRASYLGGGLGACNGSIQGNVIARNSAVGHGGGLAYCSGSIRNNIVVNNTAPMGVGGGLHECHADIANNTICFNSTLNGGGGLFNCNGQVTNCIVWSNLPEQIVPDSNVEYSDVEGGCPGLGNIDIDPFFADPCKDDYHLQSAAGHWDPNTKMWVKDASTSLCIDAGDPNSDWTAELWPNGKRINMGAYGGTAEASMSLSTVGNIANLDNDPCDTVDLNDLAIFVEKWCYEEYLLAEDLDRDGDVDFEDYAVFSREYYDTHLSEPGIFYEIGECGQGAAQQKLSQQTEQSRFTATVQGNNILFMDTMTANCCPDRLWLDMDVSDNTIIIYEHEELSYPCFCICQYPVDAIFGPFRRGTYTLEVYEDYGGFIGSTLVTID